METEINRKLVRLERVEIIEDIPEAEKIVLAHIKGWQCVVKKGEFKEGDWGLYFEVDSFLPVTDARFEFLRKGCYKKMGEKEGFRLKTIKLRGTISQGLLLPLKEFNEFIPFAPFVGEDLSESLGVIKYEPPIPAQLTGIQKGNFPGYIPKTDAERIENLPEIFSKYPDMDFEVTEKLNGTSCTIFYNDCQFDCQFGICSRNLELCDTPENTLWNVARKHNLQEKMVTLNRNLAIQGEMCGEGINKNPLKLQGQELFVFDIYDIYKQEYLDPKERIKMVIELGLEHVPIISMSEKTLIDIAILQGISPTMNSMSKLIQRSNGKSKINPDAKREGLVYKSYQKDKHGNRMRFKTISREFLLTEEE